MSDQGSNKRPGEPQEGSSSKRITRNSNPAPADKPERRYEPLLPFEIPEQVDAVQPSEVLNLPGFSKDVYAQDLFAIFSAAPASQPYVVEMHNAWFKCRRPGLDELWASRHPSQGGYQKSLPRHILRKIHTLEKLLQSATAEPLVRKLQVLLLDHLMLMRVTYTSWELPSHYFPDFEARFGGLIEALGTAESLAAAAGTSFTGSGTANITPEVRTRIANLRVDPKTVTPLDHISGNVEGKRRIKRNILLSTEVPHLITKGHEPQNILLHGPPGTGKTLLAMASAAENKDCAVYSVLSSDLIERWQGASEQNIVALFAIAAETAPAVIVINEIEGLCLSRSSSSASETSTHRIANAFLASMTKYSRVLVIGTTNLPWQLDQAFGRRFRSKIHVSLPPEAARLDILRSRLQQLNHTVSEAEMVSVARDCRGYTGDAVSEIVNAARAELIDEIGAATHFRPIVFDGKRRYFPCHPGDANAVKRRLEDFKKDGLTEQVTTRPLTMHMLRRNLDDLRSEVSASVAADNKHADWSRHQFYN